MASFCQDFFYEMTVKCIKFGKYVGKIQWKTSLGGKICENWKHNRKMSERKKLK